MQNRSLKNFTWNTIGSTVNSFASLFFLIIVTRLNGVEASGIFSVCFSFSFILYTISSLGGRVFEVSDTNKFSDNCYYTVKYFFCIISVIVAVGFSLFSKYEPYKFLLLFALMLIRSIEAFSDTYYAVFQKNGRLDIVGKSYLIKTIVVLFSFFVVDYLFKDILISSFFYLVAVLLTFLFYDKTKIKNFKTIKFQCDKAKIFELIKEIKYFVLFNFLIILIANIPRIIVDYKYSNAELGYFGIIIMVPSIMVLMGQLIIHPYLNEISNNYNNKDYKKFLYTTRKIAFFISLAAIVCTVVAYFIGPIVLEVMYNISFKNYSKILALMVIAGAFNVLVVLLSTVLTVMRKTKQQLWIYLAVVVLEIVMMYLGTGRDFSLIFILYLIVMIIQSVLFFIYFISCLKKRNIKLRGYEQ